MNIEIFDIVMIGLIIILIETWYLCIKVKNMLDKNHDQLLCFMWGHVPEKHIWIQASWEPRLPELEGKTFNFCKHCRQALK